MENFKSQIIHVVETVEKLNLPERIEAVSYLQKITEAYKKDSLFVNDLSNVLLKNSNTAVSANKTLSKNLKHKCKNHLCSVYNIKHLKRIVCFKCKKHVESEFQLFEHSQTHLDYPVSCIHCRCSFRNVEDYNYHKTLDCKQRNKECFQNLQKYVCKVCNSPFVNKKTFQSHLLDNHGMKLYNNWYGCKLCSEMFEQKKMLYHHYKLAHSELKCKLSTKKPQQEVTNVDTRGNDSSVSKHEQLFENNDQNVNSSESDEFEKFQCIHCTTIFKQKSLLTTHVKRCHLRQKKFICDLCKKTFTVYRNYKRHLKSSSHQNKDGQDDYPLFKCELCDKIYTNHDALSRHQIRIHFTGDKQLKCPLCDFKTSLATSLSRHVNLHTDSRKFICDQCGSCFHTLSALKEHKVYVHSNERNYSCEICGQRFKLKSGLNRHFKTHSDEKDFKCFCGQVYKFRTNLRRHLQIAHKMVNKKSGVARVTIEEEGYAINSPKMVKRKIKQVKTNTLDATKMDEFDIPSLGALSDVDLSCADEVLGETYDNFSKYSTESTESQESFGSILPPVNLIDHVFQNNSNNHSLREDKQLLISSKQYASLVTNESVHGIGNSLSSVNYKPGTCRQYLTSSLNEMSSNDQYSLPITSKVSDSQYLNSLENGISSACESNFGRQYSSAHYLQEMHVEGESPFCYSKWLNQIL